MMAKSHREQISQADSMVLGRTSWKRVPVNEFYIRQQNQVGLYFL